MVPGNAGVALMAWSHRDRRCKSGASATSGQSELKRSCNQPCQGDQGQGFPGGAAGLQFGLALPLPELLRQPLVRHHHQGRRGRPPAAENLVRARLRRTA